MKREAILIGIMAFVVLFAASVYVPDIHRGNIHNGLSLMRDAEASSPEEGASEYHEKASTEEYDGEEGEENIENDEFTKEEPSHDEHPEANENDTEEDKKEIEAGGKAEAEEEGVPEIKLASLNEELKVIAAHVEGIVDRLGKIQESAKKKEKEDLASGLADLEEKVASFKKQSELVRGLNEELSKKGAAHFTAWERDLTELQNKSLKDKGEKRRAKQLETFKDFEDKMAKVVQELGSFQSNVQEISSYLKYDLRQESVREISGEIDKVKKGGGNISKQIRDAQKDLDSLPVL